MQFDSNTDSTASAFLFSFDFVAFRSRFVAQSWRLRPVNEAMRDVMGPRAGGTSAGGSVVMAPVFLVLPFLSRLLPPVR